MRTLVSLIWLSALLVLASVSTTAAAAQSIPTPESVLGYPVGADFHLATYEDSIAYFQKLDEASDRLQLLRVGETSEGRPFYMAVISSPENLAHLDRYKEIAQRLAHPAGLTDEQAHELAKEGKAIVHIDGAVHASEVACHQHTLELAYRLVTGDSDPAIRNILDNVIFLLWPTLNPDGQTMVVDWYRSNVGTPYEVSPLPRLYQKYVGHDNNRDAYMLDMIESRVITRTENEWEPQIFYTQHQTAPFPTRIWLPPFAEPIGSRVHPLMSRTVNSIGMLMAQALEERGRIGATHMGTGFDAWYPGYVDYLPMLRNTAAFWTETALYHYATPHFYTVDDFPEDERSLRSQSLYPSPWKGGWWRLRDAVDYMLTTSMATLDYAAKFKEDLLYNRYQAGRDTIRKYTKEPPFAYFVPREQRDPVAAAELLRRLATNGIRVSVLDSAVTQEGVSHPAGTWVVPMDQEFAELARQVLEVQTYPDLREFPEGPPEQPYDASAWTLPYQMDVRVFEADAPLGEDVRRAMNAVEGKAVDWREGELETDASPWDSVPGVGFDTDPVAAGIVPPPGELSGTGPVLVVDPVQNNAFRAVNRAFREGARVALDAEGKFVIRGLSDPSTRDLVETLRLRASRAPASLSATEISRPRIGLHRPWVPSMDEGWTRWLLEQYRFDFVSLEDSEIRNGDLHSRLDVVILTDTGRGSIVEGFAEGEVPPRYSGGIGDAGARSLEAFVRQGGTLVCFNRASTFAIEALHLPVEDVVAKLDRKDFYVSGSILEVEVDRRHPVMAGMPERAKVFVDHSPVFTTLGGFEGRALAKYPKSGSPLLSGYLLGEEHLDGYAAALEVVHGKGHVILLGFRPQWRGQPFGTFRVVFDAALFHGAVAGERRGTPDFWKAPEKAEKAEKPKKNETKETK